MATRQKGQVQTPLEMPMWVSLTWDVFQSMSPGPPNRPKALVCTTHGDGVQTPETAQP